MAEPSPPRIHLAVALRCEAAPLVVRFGLRRTDDAGPFRRYRNERLELIVSGPGVVNMAAACGYLHAATATPAALWLNVGIAGSAHHPLGAGYLGRRIVDRESGATWQPRLERLPFAATATICTVSRPERTFSDDCLYDMEAAGLFAACRRFVGAERVQTFKVVSDAPGDPPPQPNAATALIAGQLGTIERILAAVEADDPTNDPPGR